MKRLLGAAVVAVLAVSLVACSGKARVRQPAELVKVSNQFDLAPVWSVSIGSSEPFNFHPAVVGDAVYAASRRGSLRKMDLQKNDQILLTKNDAQVTLAHLKSTIFTDRLVAKFKLPIEGWRGE